MCYLQAQLQNILGKPKYQLKQEADPDFLMNVTNLIIKDFYDTEGFNTNLQTTQIFSMIYEFYGSEIESMKSLMIIAESQFVDTKKVIGYLGIAYVLFCFVPFLVQLYTNTPLVVYICLGMMFLIQCFMLSLEFLQMKSLSW
jgi:hypothetical protein